MKAGLTQKQQRTPSHQKGVFRQKTNNGIVQLKKTELGNDWKKIFLISHEDKQVYENNDDEPIKKDKVWQHLNARYDESLAKGVRNWGLLQDSINSYRDDKEQFTENMQASRKDYMQKYQEHYRTRLTKKKDGPVETNTWGVNEEHPTTESQGSSAYFNKFDVDSGTIYGTSNFADKDKVRVEDKERKDEIGYEAKGLPNSEIIWQQYFDVAKSNFWVRKESKAKAKMKQVNKMVRENVVNMPAQQVVFMSYPNNESWNNDKVWRPDDEEFKAILGTPNASVAAFMLKDHMDEVGGKTINQIQTTSNQYIIVDFAPLPALDQAAEAEVNADAAASIIENNEGIN